MSIIKRPPDPYFAELAGQVRTSFDRQLFPVVTSVRRHRGCRRVEIEIICVRGVANSYESIS